MGILLELLSLILGRVDSMLTITTCTTASDQLLYLPLNTYQRLIPIGAHRRCCDHTSSDDLGPGVTHSLWINQHFDEFRARRLKSASIRCRLPDFTSKTQTMAARRLAVETAAMIRDNLGRQRRFHSDALTMTPKLTAPSVIAQVGGDDNTAKMCDV